jgi:hypothetical protein
MDLININPLACPWKHIPTSSGFIYMHTGYIYMISMSLHMKTLTDTFITCGHMKIFFFLFLMNVIRSYELWLIRRFSARERYIMAKTRGHIYIFAVI